jgi:hypothetical protein
VCRITTGEIKLHEHKTFIWLSPEKLHELDWAEADILVLDDYRKTQLKRSYYSNTIAHFRSVSPEEIIGQLTISSYTVEQTQTHAWREEINLLQNTLRSYEGKIYFEYAIPRMGRRIDVVLLVGAVIFVLEFKVGQKEFTLHDIDQICDYALDLKNFHESSYSLYIAPILIATEAKSITSVVAQTPQNDRLLDPIMSNGENLVSIITHVLKFADGVSIDAALWEQGRYRPTPTIIEAAMAYITIILFLRLLAMMQVLLI